MTKLLSKLIAVLFQLLLLATMAQPAGAQSLPLIRDAEIEGLLKDYTAPIFAAAGLGKGSIDVLLVNNNSFNAFVSNRRMFIHTGALARADTPNEIIGVIAHETGHIIGGHQQRMRDRFEKAQILAAVGILLGAGAMVSGGDLGDAAGQAIIMGGGQSLQRSLLAYQRDEESSADRAGLSLLEKTRQSGKGMIDTFKLLDSQLLFSTSQPDPYLQSHPMPRERIALLQTAAAASPYYSQVDDPDLQLRHDMMRAKIAAYSGGLGAVRAIFKKNPNSPAALYGTAISQFLTGKSKPALVMIDKLLKQQPKNAYLYEMKAEILLRSGDANGSLKPMQTAISLDPYKSGLLRIQYGQMLIETNNPANYQVAINEIKAGLGRDPNTISGYTFLARAYAKIGDETRALAATAEERFLAGNYDDAKSFAFRAQKNLTKNTPEWLRLEDIVLYKKPKK
jgi:predicted Zn-dependent protease